MLTAPSRESCRSSSVTELLEISVAAPSQPVLAALALPPQGSAYRRESRPRTRGPATPSHEAESLDCLGSAVG